MDSNMDQREGWHFIFFIGALAALCAALIAGLLRAVEVKRTEYEMPCVAAGGKLIELRSGWLCVRADAIINPTHLPLQ